MLTLADLHRAQEIVRRQFPPTPLIYAPRLSEHLNSQVYLKLECFTPIRTFKIRGALAKLQSLMDDGVSGGVVTASAGNHGMAVARAARLYNRPAVVCVPENANPQKVARIAAEGARVVAEGSDYQEAFDNSLRIGREEGLTLVHAYDDPYVIAGQGTVGVELADAGVAFDAVTTGVGGGGLISGLGMAVKTLLPGVQVIGVEPEGAPAMIRSVKAGSLVELDKVDTIADGLAARKPGQHTLAMTTRYTDRLLTVSDEDLWAAMKFLLHQERIVAEPAGVAGVAALLRHGASQLGRVVVIISGANISDSAMSRIC